MYLVNLIIGIVQGVLAYLFFNDTLLDNPESFTWTTIMTFVVPLTALQLKLPSKDIAKPSLLFLAISTTMYGLTSYFLLNEISATVAILANYAALGSLIILSYYCAIIEGKSTRPSYEVLYQESWLVVTKMALSMSFALIGMSMFYLGAALLDIMNVSFLAELLVSGIYGCIAPFLFLSIAISTFNQYESIVYKVQDIFLTFSRILYPLFMPICLLVILLVPFADLSLSTYWPLVSFLAAANIFWFNAFFRSGPKDVPNSQVFVWLIYTLICGFCVLNSYILKISFELMVSSSIFSSEAFLVFIAQLAITLYYYGYTVAIFYSKKSWLELIKPINISLALLLAGLYPILAVVTCIK